MHGDGERREMDGRNSDGKDKVRCGQCGKYFDGYNLKKHISYVHGLKESQRSADYMCSQPGCSKGYNSKHRLTEHMNSHKCVHKCSVCDISFYKKSNLTRHMKKKHL